MSTVPHTVLPVLPATGLLRERVAGRPLAWSRDMALVGGLTSGFAPFAAGSLAPSGYAPTALVLGLLSGALLGLCMPALLEQVRGRVPLAGLLLLSPVAGFAWGGPGRRPRGPPLRLQLRRYAGCKPLRLRGRRPLCRRSIRRRRR